MSETEDDHSDGGHDDEDVDDDDDCDDDNIMLSMMIFMLVHCQRGKAVFLRHLKIDVQKKNMSCQFYKLGSYTYTFNSLSS